MEYLSFLICNLSGNKKQQLSNWIIDWIIISRYFRYIKSCFVFEQSHGLCLSLLLPTSHTIVQHVQVTGLTAPAVTVPKLGRWQLTPGGLKLENDNQIIWNKKTVPQVVPSCDGCFVKCHLRKTQVAWVNLNLWVWWSTNTSNNSNNDNNNNNQKTNEPEIIPNHSHARDISAQILNIPKLKNLRNHFKDCWKTDINKTKPPKNRNNIQTNSR